MKKSVLLLIVLFLASFLFAQKNILPVKKWETAAGTSVSSGSIESGLTINPGANTNVYSNEFEIFKKDYPGFGQEVSFIIKPDTLSGLGDNVSTELDTVEFYPIYYLGQSYGWFTGAKMTFSVVSGDREIDSIASTIILPSYTGKTFIWKTVPNDTTLKDSAFVQNVAWEKIKFRATFTGDSTYFNLSGDLIIKETK